jgi:hypothetical protein
MPHQVNPSAEAEDRPDGVLDNSLLLSVSPLSIG